MNVGILRKNDTIDKKDINFKIVKYIKNLINNEDLTREMFDNDPITNKKMLRIDLGILNQDQQQKIQTYIKSVGPNIVMQGSLSLLDDIKKIYSEMKASENNEKCSCNSGKKYELCCLKSITEPNLSIYIDFLQSITKPNLSIYIDFLKKEFPDQQVLDISASLDTNTNTKYAENCLKKKVILIAERNNKNDALFIQKRALSADVKIMYKGVSIFFEYENFEEAKATIKRLIRGNLEMSCDLCSKICAYISPCKDCPKGFCMNCINEKISGMKMEGNFSMQCPKCKSKNGLQLVNFK